MAKTVLKKNKVTGFILADFKTYYKALVIKPVWYCMRKDSYRDHWNTIESPKIRESSVTDF